jgi:hypothetical protein
MTDSFLPDEAATGIENNQHPNQGLLIVSVASAA